MAISKPKSSNLLDDLVLNLDPFALNGLGELDAPSAAIQGTPEAQDSSGDQAPGPQVTGTVPPASGDVDIPDAPTVSLFRVELPAFSVEQSASGIAEATVANAEGDAPPTVAGTPLPAPKDPGPQDPPPTVAGTPLPAPEDPEPEGPPPTVQEGAVNPSGPAAPESADGTGGGSGIAAGISLTDWWLA
jgi:hypothetical protein